ncbi:hypothetical protein COLO4_34043 [Corchorus olitorius]|uniref:Uncharacterized protein n=1 Tax=Corchorus olitorius TaxID=93759 RepID=A0A1R3GNY2_9ROSI|nr:hypothetical protein COLO4_34043 [Corchorus olitorius]
MMCQICKRGNYTALDSYHRFNHSYQSEEIPKHFAALSIVENPDGAWFPDTPVSNHMTSDPGNLSTNSVPPACLEIEASNDLDQSQPIADPNIQESQSHTSVEDTSPPLLIDTSPRSQASPPPLPTISSSPPIENMTIKKIKILPCR